ncbi:hypothetical protein HYC85_019855 [Camellia sinensis]|uniref:Phosphoglycerate kinase n=1 Tax=Camellia sinensis TaxID=4442 RepID=A0A7J7GN56_CAMSI|nr:hypothetical protein HYC85_019855 [Camellia sinensis]
MELFSILGTENGPRCWKKPWNDTTLVPDGIDYETIKIDPASLLYSFVLNPLRYDLLQERLIEFELDYLVGAVSNRKRPFAAIVGGSKVSSKIGVIESILEKCDILLLMEEEKLDLATSLLAKVLHTGNAEALTKICNPKIGDKPQDSNQQAKINASLWSTMAGLLHGMPWAILHHVLGVCLHLHQQLLGHDFGSSKGTNDCGIKVLTLGWAHLDTRPRPKEYLFCYPLMCWYIMPATGIPDGWMGLDIGLDSIKTFNDALDTTKTIIWNGTTGVFEFEKFAAGTEV